MKTKSLTTPEQAAAMCGPTRRGFPASTMLFAIANIRRDEPTLTPYLTHTDIIVGLGEGRFGPNGLRRRLTELEAIDSGENFSE